MSETADQAATRRRWVTLAELVAVAGVLIAAATLYLNWSGRRADEAARAAQATSTERARGVVTLIAPQDALPGPRIASDWFADALLKANDGKDARSGRLPVLITVSWWDGATNHSQTGLYDVLWRTEARFLRGRKLELTGLTLASRSATPAALEAAWQRKRAK